MSLKTFIYGLKDPFTDKIRYIGKSDNPKDRLSQHLSLPKSDVNLYKKRWLKQLKAKGVKPELVILEKVNYKDWEDKEKKWIKYGRHNNWPLTNISNGGLFNFYSSDLSLELLDVMMLYVPEKFYNTLKEMSFDELGSIAQQAAVASAKSTLESRKKDRWDIGYFISSDVIVSCLEQHNKRNYE